jgi:histidinol-phosphate aminotransferase
VSDHTDLPPSRPAVAQLPAYRPGKGAAQAEAEHGITNAIKLASNENPDPPVASILAAVSRRRRPPAPTATPTTGRTAVRERIGTWLGVDPAGVTVGAGSVGLLQQLFLTFVDPGDEVVYPWRSFEVYPVYTRLMAGREVTTPLTAAHTFDLDALAAAITPDTRMVLLATPNNPTGTALRTTELRDLLTAISPRTVVVIDEAYREFLDPAFGDPVVELVPDFPNVVVTRTFSKAHGLAGIRVGYAIGHPEVIASIDKTLFPFAVNALAQAAAIAAIDSMDEIQASGRPDPGRAGPRDRRAVGRRLAAARRAGELRVPAARCAHRRGVPRAREAWCGHAPVLERGHPRDDRQRGAEHPVPRHAGRGGRRVLTRPSSTRGR